MISTKLSNLFEKNCRLLLATSLRHNSNISNIYEPDYLDSLQPDGPIYETLNVQITGYDYPILEKFQKQIHKMADAMNIDVEDGWATPSKNLLIKTYKPVSTAVESEYKLTVFERNIQFDELSSLDYPILLRVIREMLPEGVNLNVHKNLPEHTEIRYVPDNELLNLKQQLTEMGGPSKKKRK